jgi:hypothetical protein
VKSSVNDTLIGIAVLLGGAALLLYFFGLAAVAYLIWLVVCGYGIFWLARSEFKAARVLAVIMLPTLLLARSPSKSVKKAISDIDSKVS